MQSDWVIGLKWGTIGAGGERRQFYTVLRTTCEIKLDRLQPESRNLKKLIEFISKRFPSVSDFFPPTCLSVYSVSEIQLTLTPTQFHQRPALLQAKHLIGSVMQ